MKTKTVIKTNTNTASFEEVTLKIALSEISESNGMRENEIKKHLYQGVSFKVDDSVYCIPSVNISTKGTNPRTQTVEVNTYSIEDLPDEEEKADGRKCGDHCINAKSDKCSCRCGGKNHGTGYKTNLF